MDFPHPFVPDMATRAGRMMSAGRCKVTITRKDNSEHITVLYNCFADNRDKQFDPDSSKRWVSCELADATHVFVEVPTPSGSYNDKILTYYPGSGRSFDADNADPQRTRSAILGAMWIQAPESPFLLGFDFQEAAECGVCGLELTDPISIARGIGPTCYGRLTGSTHQVKWSGSVDRIPLSAEEKVERDPDGSVHVEHAHKYHVPATDAEEVYEELGLPSAAENAAYGLLRGMSEEQLRLCEEWVGMRIEEVVRMRKALVAESQDARGVHQVDQSERDQTFLGR